MIYLMKNSGKEEWNTLLPIEKQYVLTDDSMLFNCGDWLSNFSYLIFNQEAAKPQLMIFKSPESREGDINA